MVAPLPPIWLIRGAVAAVWLYEGLWCKLMNGEPHQLKVVAAVPYFSPRTGRALLKTRGRSRHPLHEPEAAAMDMGAYRVRALSPVPPIHPRRDATRRGGGLRGTP